MALFSILLARLFSSFKIGAILFLYFWFLGLSANIIFFKEAIHFASPFWIIIINILVIYILGFYHGIVTLLASAIVYIYYVEYGFWDSVERIQIVDKSILYSVYFEVIFAVITLAYLLYVIIENNRKPDIILNEKNKELVKQNKRIKASDEEKTVMLKEIHHRVKNNLQIVTSLLRLQMEDLKSDEAIGKFKESINRIIAMSMIHEKMYQSDSLNKINIQDYFKELTDDIKTSYNLNNVVSIKLKCKIDQLDIKTLVPLALLVNELLSNSLKHAFTEIQAPEVTIEFSELGEDLFLLMYSDNGKWVEPSNKKTLGLELITSFCEQMEGELDFSSNPTKYVFRLKKLSFEE